MTIYNPKWKAKRYQWLSLCFAIVAVFFANTGVAMESSGGASDKSIKTDVNQNEVNQAVSAGVESAEGSCHLRVGWGIWPPYQYLSDAGEPQGIQITLLNAIAQQANCELEYIQQPFSQNIQDIKSGKIDMMADTTITAERQEFARFSAAYRSEIMVLYVKSEKLASCQDLSLMELLDTGFKLGLTQGNLYGEEVIKMQSNIRYQDNIVYLKENKESINAILNNQIDGYFEDPAVQAYESKRNGLGGQLVSCKIEIYAGRVSLMFSKKTVDLKTVEKINLGLSTIKKSDHYINNWEW